ncbi:MAG: efflux RND transporter periplasmic adaptor subunit [Terriglobales bacterium]|jgi:HlyD family secretion protein|nr:efflux RND transporter periplasmic adaptor subunit [Terriglobales bacterium]
MASSQNKNGGRRWLLWSVAIVVGIVLLASFMSRGDPVSVIATTVQRTTIRSVVTTNGKVEPLASFEAHAPVGTTVKKLLVKEGDSVKKGELLVQMDDAEARAQAARALSQMRNSDAETSAIHSGGNQEEVLTLQSDLVKARTERDAALRSRDALRRLEQNNAASPGEVKAAEEQLQRADADLKLLEQKQKDRYSRPEISKVEAQTGQAESAYTAAQDLLSQLNVRAPFDGIVYSLPVHQGAYVNPGDLILQEADLSKVLVRAFVDEPDVARLAPGQPIEVTWDAIPGRVWNGQLTSVPATLRLHGTRNVGETTCVVSNSDRKLLPNVNVGVSIVTAEHKGALTVPREAIHQDDSKPYLYQILDNELERRDVETSISNLTQVEITGGIPEKALVALASTNSKPLHSGLIVKVVH